jgi:hypothetical protein
LIFSQGGGGPPPYHHPMAMYEYRATCTAVKGETFKLEHFWAKFGVTEFNHHHFLGSLGN